MVAEALELGATTSHAAADKSAGLQGAFGRTADTADPWTIPGAVDCREGCGQVRKLKNTTSGPGWGWAKKKIGEAQASNSGDGGLCMGRAAACYMTSAHFRMQRNDVSFDSKEHRKSAARGRGSGSIW